MGQFVRHDSCESCGSSDGKAIYEDGSYYCWVCGDTKASQEYIDELKKQGKPIRVRSSVNKGVILEVKQSNKPPMSKAEWEAIKQQTQIDPQGYRGLTADTCKKFGIRHAFSATDEVIEQYYPITKDSEIVGAKIREVPKDFRSIGQTGADCDLFMQFKFNRGGKYVVLCEGEIDALSAYQMLNDYNRNKYGENSDFETAVVSATIGANGHKQIAAQYKFFDGFEQIIVAYDNDKAGKTATEELVKYLPKGKIKIMTLRYKDANEYLTKNDATSFVRDFYEAKPFTPVGVLGSGNLYEKILEQAEIEKVPFPPFMQKLNDMLVGGIPLGHIINIAAGTGLGKCLGEGTPVLMYDGTIKPVEEIKNGDFVMGPDGDYRKVIGVTSGEDELYRVDQVKGDSYVVNSAHILSLRASYANKALSVTQGDIVSINVLDYLSLNSKSKHCLKGWKADLDNSNIRAGLIDDWYMIGLWLAEGTRTKPQLTLSNKDRELFDFVANFANSKNYTVKVYKGNDKVNCTTIDLVGGFKSFLRDYGVLDCKNIPKEVFTANGDVQLSVLAGFIDGDGYVKDNGITMTLSDNKMAEDIVLLARLNGFAVTTKLVNKTWQNGEGIYRYISISGNLSKIPNVLKRKQCVERKQIKNHLNTGITVNHIGRGKYFGFELEGNDKLFCLGDLTVTHNTSFINEIIYHWIFSSPHLVGIVSMELDAGQYGETLLSRHLQRKLSLIKDNNTKMNLLRSQQTADKAKELFFKEDDQHRFYLLDNRDGTIEEIQDTIEELAVSCGCRIIVLDPLQDILDGLSNEEQALFMKWCKGMIKSHNITFILINHIRKAASGQSSSSQGSSFTEEEIQGSSTIIKSASANILLSRNKYADDPVERNTTKVMLSKNRICGITGPAGEVYYDNDTHTLHDKAEYFTDS